MGERAPGQRWVPIGFVEGEDDRGEYLMDPPVMHDDPYFWLRDDDREDESVLAHLRAENGYADRKTAHLSKLRGELYAEMKARMKETDTAVPFYYKGYYYYSRTEEGKAYRLQCRRAAPGPRQPVVDPSSLPTPEEVLYDANELAKGHGHCDVGSWEVSHAGDLLVYAVDYDGDEVYSLRVKELPGGTHRPDTLEGVTDTFEWAPQGHGFFYLALDEKHRPNKVFWHTLGTGQSEDVELFDEPDEELWLGLEVSTSERFLIVTSGGQQEDVVRVLDMSALQPGARPVPDALRLMQPQVPNLRYSIDHFVAPKGLSGGVEEEVFLVVTSLGEGKEGRLMVAPVETPAAEHWRPIFKYDTAVQAKGASCYRHFTLLRGRADGLPQAWVLCPEQLSRAAAAALRLPVEAQALDWSPPADFPVLTPVRLPTEDDIFDLFPRGNHDFEAEQVRYYYSSPMRPWAVMEFDAAEQLATMQAQQLEVAAAGSAAGGAVESVAWPAAIDGRRERARLLKQKDVPTFDPSKYECRRVWCTVNDERLGREVRIPVSLMWRSDRFGGAAQLPKGAPTILEGYGAYGCPSDMYFRSHVLTAIDRGVLLAVAHVRGGGDSGRAWYEDMGKLETKSNSFTDFCAVARFLAAEGLSDARRIVSHGGSAGGLLVAAAMTQEPELWAGVVGDVPFVDVLVTMSDPGIPLTVVEWKEWGNPGQRRWYDVIRAYSPMDNLARPDGGQRQLPPTLLTAGLHDPRVGYWEPAKFAARMRDACPDGGQEVLLKTDMASGHMGASDRYKAIKEAAFLYAWVLDRLGCANMKV